MLASLRCLSGSIRTMYRVPHGDVAIVHLRDEVPGIKPVPINTAGNSDRYVGASRWFWAHGEYRRRRRISAWA